MTDRMLILGEDDYQTILTALNRFKEEAGNQLANTAHLPEIHTMWQEDMETVEQSLTVVKSSTSGVKIHAATITHRHGTNFYIAFTSRALQAEIWKYVREYWDDILDDHPMEYYAEGAVEHYFEQHPEEWLDYAEPEPVGKVLK